MTARDEDNAVPNWDLLVESPAEFFKLPVGHGRKDLKRSYNRWLRRFKPESCPEEFARLHAAYKQLEAALTGGGVAAGHGVVGGRGDSAPPTPDGSTAMAADAEVVDAAGALGEEVLVDSAEVAHARRAAMLAPSAQTFVELALLSDVVDHPAQHGEPSSEFLSWLLTGVRQYPGDAPLRAWIACLCADRAAAPAIRASLPALASALSAADFALMTEPVWREFLRCRPFDEFLAAWDACWRDAGSVGSAHHACTTLEILPAAMWSADTAWIDRQIAWLQEDHALLGDDVDEQFGALSIVRDHLQVRREFRARGPVHEQLDSLMLDLSTLDRDEADRRFIGWQLETQRDGGALLAEFSPGQPDSAAAYAFLERACVGVEARIDEDGRGLQRERAVEVLCAHFVDLARKTRRSVVGRVWELGMMLGLVVTAAVVTAVIVAAVVVAGLVIVPVVAAGAGGAVLGWFLARYLYRKALVSMRSGIEFRGAMGCYRRIWRAELVELMRRTQLPAVVARELLQDELDRGQLTRFERRCGAWLVTFLGHDVGLCTWSLANRGG